ncbi:hypothetical protein J6590_096269 [Homalodisca vitripennis]|nr:hypothetical protein J6590_031353 [Homalodisca vitripennis]KAG8334183.1 hypothetical protein J6590_096269 [Homalodisca vitripennis]
MCGSFFRRPVQTESNESAVEVKLIRDHAISPRQGTRTEVKVRPPRSLLYHAISPRQGTRTEEKIRPPRSLLYHAISPRQGTRTEEKIQPPRSLLQTTLSAPDREPEQSKGAIEREICRHRAQGRQLEGGE